MCCRLLYLMCCRLLTSYVCNRLLEKKNRPNKDPIWAKGLYYRPRSLNKDPSCHIAGQWKPKFSQEITWAYFFQHFFQLTFFQYFFVDFVLFLHFSLDFLTLKLAAVIILPKDITGFFNSHPWKKLTPIIFWLLSKSEV